MFSTDCTKFVKCSDNTINQCPAGTRFDYSLQLCNWANNVDCITLSIVTTATTQTQSTTNAIVTTKIISPNDPSIMSYFK